MKKEIKDNLKILSLKELNKKLEELRIQLFKDTAKCVKGSTRQINSKKSHVDLKGIRHKIAFIKTIINAKYGVSSK